MGYITKTHVKDEKDGNALNDLRPEMGRFVLASMVVCLMGVANAGIMLYDSSIGLCPEVTPKADLDPVPYLGLWYEIERFSLLWEGLQDCVTAYYDDLGDGVVGVHNAARRENGEINNINGTATVIAPGVLLVEFPGHASAEYKVLDTDYTSFSSVYNCDQVGERRFQYAWVLSRTNKLDDATLSTAQQAFTDNGVNLGLFNVTYQGDDCPYPNYS